MPSAKLVARWMLCRISVSASVGGLERVDGIGRHRLAQMRLQRILVHNVDRAAEQLGDVSLQPRISEDVQLQFGVELDQDIQIAPRTSLAPCD